MKYFAVAAALVLAACTAPPPVLPPPANAPAAASQPAAASPAGAPTLQCEDGVTLRWRMAGEELLLTGLPGGEQRLLRDAGGVTPGQTVWRNERLRAEFGLGDRRDEAALQLLQGEPRTLRCRP